MEISSFPTLHCHNSIEHHHLSYRHSSYCRKTFVQKPNRRRRIHQRLIPLTEEILRDMADFNASQSTTSISDRATYNTINLTSLVRNEMANVLQEFIRKEDIYKAIDKYIKENVNIIQEKDDKSIAPAPNNEADLPDEDTDMTVQVLKGFHNNKQMIENVEMLQRRVHDIEDFLRISEIRNLQKPKLKIKNEDFEQSKCTTLDDPIDVKTNKQQVSQTTEISTNGEEQPQGYPQNMYDEMYYKTREYFTNLLNYKKSQVTFELNKKPHLNPYVKPKAAVLPQARLKPQQRSTFIVNNN